MKIVKNCISIGHDQFYSRQFQGCSLSLSISISVITQRPTQWIQRLISPEDKGQYRKIHHSPPLPHTSSWMVLRQRDNFTSIYFLIHPSHSTIHNLFSWEIVFKKPRSKYLILHDACKSFCLFRTLKYHVIFSTHNNCIKFIVELLKMDV